MKLRDGRLLCITRTGHVPARPVHEQCWSSDGGRTSTDPLRRPNIPGVTPEQRKIIGPGGRTSQSGSAAVSPMLALLENGVLALAYGRPGQHVAFSAEYGHELDLNRK